MTIPAEMITPELYRIYFSHLTNGRRSNCAAIVQELLDQDIPLHLLYTELFQKSLYEVGRLWEINQISVAREHLVTAITESLLDLVYPRLFKKISTSEKTVVISCTANEYHQVGGKIIADIFEYHGWNSHFLGANTPVDELLKHIDESNPELVGLSLSIYFNLPVLKTTIESIQSTFNSLDLLVGGQAFNWGGSNIVDTYKRIEYVPSLAALEKQINSGR